MPFLRLTLHPAVPNLTKTRLAVQLTKLMASELGKKAELTSVLVETPSDAVWTIGETDANRTAMLEAVITESTNNEVQKARFIASAHELMKSELPDFAAIAYVILKEVPAGSWGYDGMTQAARRTSQPV